MGLVTSEKKITLENIGHGGAAAELFQVELDKVLKDILDLNTNPTPRKITLEVILTPNPKHREMFGIAIGCKSVLGGQGKFESLGEIDSSTGKLRAFEKIPRQEPIFNQNTISMLDKKGDTDK